MNYSIFTSESVAAGHPDKICDQISDAIVDAALAQDPNAHCGIETLVTTNQVILAGEMKIKNNVVIDYDQITREVIKDLGYINPQFGFDHRARIDLLIHQQSQEIAVGVDAGGAGDQGMMFGYAVNETSFYIPLPISIAHRLVERLDQVREERIVSYLRPDGKSEVTVSYKGGRPVEIEKVVLAAAHDNGIINKELKADLFKQVVTPVLEEYGFEIDEKNLIVNGTGVWTTPGPASDTGVTGRKIVVDSYGGFSRVGGGCFSGKDPTKVDRSGAYAARYLAKNIVAAKLAEKVEVQIAYVIGQEYPIAFDIETFGTEQKKKSVIESFARKLLDLSVSGILNTLDLKQPIYQKTAIYGHFGREIFPWEKIKF